MKQDEEVEDVTSRINKLNEMRGGTPKHKDLSGGSSGGSGSGSGPATGIWNKFKGKKKKKRNLTAPEITTQEVKAAISPGHTDLLPLKENEDYKKEAGKGKRIFGKKKSTTETKEMKRRSKDVTGLAKNNEIVLKNDLAMTPSDSEEVILSQRSDPSLSLPDTQHDVEVEVLTPPISTKPGDTIMLEVLDLSQASGKQPTNMSPSHSGAFISNDEHFSTQSSSDVAVLHSSSAAETETETPHTQEDESISVAWDNREDVKEEEELDDDPYRSFLLGSSTLYEEFGSKQHKLNLKKVHEFLESCGEMEPVDLKLLLEWDGWIVAVRDIV